MSTTRWHSSGLWTPHFYYKTTSKSDSQAIKVQTTLLTHCLSCTSPSSNLTLLSYLLCASLQFCTRVYTDMILCWSLPLHRASWMFALHLPNEMHLISSLAPDRMNPWGQLSWHTVPEMAGSSPHLGGKTVTPAGFWRMGQRFSARQQ